MSMRGGALIGLLGVLLAVQVWAHKPSDSYLTITVQNQSVQAIQSIQGQWDIALRDLDYAIGLDSDGDGAITWGELRARHPDLAEFVLSHLEVRADQRRCSSQAHEHLVDYHSDGAYAVLRFSIDCPRPPTTLTLHYRLFFDLDPLHRGLLALDYQGLMHTAVFSPEEATREFILGQMSRGREFTEFLREGVWHIWIGYDHVLFLVSLLMPAVLWWDGRQWHPATGFRPVFWETFRLVSSFSVAHSITLTLAAFGIISVPSRLVESVIAASVVLAALNNLYPIVRARLWLMTFAFGLIHGLGFASVLMDLGLRSRSLLTALVGFNLGVEIGQLAIVIGLLPPAFWARDTQVYQRGILQAGSLLVAGVAIVWLLERSLNLDVRLF